MKTLKERYQKEIVKNLMKDGGYKNVHLVPKLLKIVVNSGCSEAVQNYKVLDVVKEDLQKVTGQLPVITRAKKSVASFKVREGMPIGAKTTLRKDKMYYFLERLISVVLPRIRDFKGLSPKAFDGNGNYSIGIQEQIVFPEVAYNQSDKNRGFSISIITSASTDNEAFSLLKSFEFPFRK